MKRMFSLCNYVIRVICGRAGSDTQKKEFCWWIIFDWSKVTTVKKNTDLQNGTILMGYQKRIHFFVAFFLVCAVFSNGALAEACFCGQACLHGPQHKAKFAVNLPFHMRCPGTLCASCVLEKGQTSKAVNSAAWTHHLKIPGTVVLNLFIDCPSNCHIFKETAFLSARGAASTVPLYLQNLSILC